jgi:hypothetical protein
MLGRLQTPEGIARSAGQSSKSDILTSEAKHRKKCVDVLCLLDVAPATLKIVYSSSARTLGRPCESAPSERNSVAGTPALSNEMGEHPPRSLGLRQPESLTPLSKNIAAKLADSDYIAPHRPIVSHRDGPEMRSAIEDIAGTGFEPVTFGL